MANEFDIIEQAIGPVIEIEKCGTTYKALYEWAKDKNTTLQNEAIESYVNDPSEVDESEIETILLIPVK